MNNKMKRAFDVIFSMGLLIVFSPILLIFIILIYCQDYKSPFYIAERVGKDHQRFKMIKLRSMIANADKSGVDSTSNADQRITRVGRIVRKFKIDELMQLVNVFVGDMSLVGPRPNVIREVDLYSIEEKKLLEVEPGITDIASIVFSDEGDILSNEANPDIAYNQLIRPGKSMLGLFYIEHKGLLMDAQICFLTGLSFFSRRLALAGINKILVKNCASEVLIKIAARDNPLVPMPPPGLLATHYNE